MEAAAVSVSEGVMGSLLGKVGDLLTGKYELMTGVRDDVMFLKTELETIYACLQDLDNVEGPSALVKAWMKEVRELSYDIEDCIDDFMLRLHADPKSKPPGFRGFMESILNLLSKTKTRHRIGTEIQGLKRRLVEVNERRVRYKLDDAVSEPAGSEVALGDRLRALYDEPPHLVGIDGPRDRLVNMLMAEEGEAQGKLKVVSIVGFGGLGKTTLVREVYQKVGGQFDCQAFVPVSRKPDLKRILKDILFEVTDQEDDRMEVSDEDILIKKLRKFLHDKRYFIVIDDIWDRAHWGNIKYALPDNNRGSKVITTTRLRDVAQSCCSSHDDRVYEMEPLSSSDSRKLFFGRLIFGFEDRCPIELKEVANEILNKCGGLPLAITTIAGLLASKSNAKEQWERVRDSIGSGLEKNPDVEEMKRILSLSYEDLPHHLKTCLLYLSIFPEDYEIESDSLVRRWVAEGFVKPRSTQNLEEVGKGYLKDLTNRSMIQPVPIIWDDSRVDACRVHDMILDLIKSKSVEENFITFFDDQSHKPMLGGKVRRLCLVYRGGEQVMMPSTMTLSSVRSLTVFGYADYMPPFLDFRALRVLELNCRERIRNCHLESIGTLWQLKYLGLRFNYISKLPKQIGKLQYLETLDLRETSVHELPASVLQLQRLTHLLVDEFVKLPDEIGKMQGLQELSRITVWKGCSVQLLQELGKLTQLRHLGLRWSLDDIDDDIGAYRDNLVLALQKLGKYSLRSLYISHFDHNSTQDFLLDSSFSLPHLQRFESGCYYYFRKLPKWLASLPNLTYINIRIFQVGDNDLQILRELPTLLTLRITSKAAPAERLVMGSRGFQCLQEFKFCCWKCVGMGLIFEAGAMPSLQDLEVPFSAKGIESLDGAFDLGIHHVSRRHLKRVEFQIYTFKDFEMKAAEAAVRDAINMHPRRPTLIISRSYR